LPAQETPLSPDRILSGAEVLEVPTVPADAPEDSDQIAADEAAKLRDHALLHRESAALARENDLLRREKAIESREAAVAAREAVVTRREKAAGYWEDVPEVERPEWPAPSIVGKIGLVMDAATGAVLHEKGADVETAVASTQKLLTALLVIEKGGLDEEFEILREDTLVEPTIIGVKAGQRYTRRALVEALLIRSGNDIARALARDHSGSVEAFAEAMTARAKALGMESSVFKNPHGLTQTGQYSTASDMAILAREAMKHDFVRECVRTKSKTFRFSDGTTRTLSNTNKLLASMPTCIGMKTGYTRASGNCLISIGKKDDREVIVVVLQSSGSWIWKDSKVLLDWGLGTGSN